MLIIISAILLSALGAFALQKSNVEVDNAGAYSIGGYIAFIISFALLEYGLTSIPLAFVFGIWAAGNAFLAVLIGNFLYGEKFSKVKGISLLFIFIGLLGLSLT